MRPFRFVAAVDWKRSLGELALIVLGVLIALSADSWWEGRQDRARERAYLEQLLSDMRENERRLERAIAGNEEIAGRIERFIEIANAPGPAPPADAIPIPLGYSVYEPLTGTYTALVQNGDLQLLRNDSLRHRIMAYSALMASTQAVLQHIATASWQDFRRATLARVGHMRPVPGEQTVGGEPVRWRQAYDAEGLLRDPVLLSVMVTQRDFGANRVRRLRGLQEPTTALRRILEAELGIEGGDPPDTSRQ